MARLVHRSSERGERQVEGKKSKRKMSWMLHAPEDWGEGNAALGLQLARRARRQAHSDVMMAFKVREQVMGRPPRWRRMKYQVDIWKTEVLGVVSRRLMEDRWRQGFVSPGDVFNLFRFFIWTLALIYPGCFYFIFFLSPLCPWYYLARRRAVIAKLLCSIGIKLWL